MKILIFPLLIISQIIFSQAGFLKLGNNINFAITKGNLSPNKSTPVRVLSTKLKNDDILRNNKKEI